MFYIVALGNPGDAYNDTRHNIGWLVLDIIRDETAASSLRYSKMIHGQIGDGNLAGEQVQYLYPGTFMNDSGRAVRAFVPPDDIERLVVLHDDVDLPLGDIKISFGKGSGGQNGVQSIIDSLKTKEFIRIRLGIAERSFWTGAPVRPSGEALSSFVLARFSKREQAKLPELAKKTQAALELIVIKGHIAAMNATHSS